ncbi:MAG TPA: hypothetical protein VM263_01850 [Acidimicrobiales bacterium]|nr:hypothetical protein [Acidimicrobiales bacterium]
MTDGTTVTTGATTATTGPAPTAGGGSPATTAPGDGGAAVQERRNRVAREVGGVEEPTDVPDLGRFLDDRPRGRSSPGREQGAGGVFVGGMLTAVGAGLVLGLRDRATTSRPAPDGADRPAE